MALGVIKIQSLLLVGCLHNQSNKVKLVLREPFFLQKMIPREIRMSKVVQTPIAGKDLIRGEIAADYPIEERSEIKDAYKVRYRKHNQISVLTAEC